MEGQPNYEDIYKKFDEILKKANETSKKVHGKYIQFICKNSDSTSKLELRAIKSDELSSKGNDYSNEEFNLKEYEKSEEFEKLEELEESEELEECENELDSMRTSSHSYYESSSCDKI